LADARRIKREKESAKDRGEFELVERSKESFRAFASEWVQHKQGIEPETREDYKRDLERAYAAFGDKSVAGVSPRDIAAFIAKLDAEGLAPRSIRRIVAPVGGAFTAARRENLRRDNPVEGAEYPKPDHDQQEKARALSREQLDALLRVVHPDHRMMLRLFAGTGLRWGEGAALRRGDLKLNGAQPYVQVRRAVTKTGRLKDPKSYHGVRDVPITTALADELRSHLASLRPDTPDSLAFPSKTGTPLRYSNMIRRRFKPAAEEAGCGWAGYHELRHTYASLRLASGTSVVQVSRLLGHHSPEFTLRKYAHLIPGDVVSPLDLDAELAVAQSESKVSPPQTGRHGTPRESELEKVPS
jgi:integrase